jgi:hypothetical protein
MKIGFSLGRCIRDIVLEKVSEDEVAFIITATNIRELEQLSLVIKDYMYRNDYLLELNEDECQRVALNLWNNNKLLQPRRQGMHRHMQPENSVWVDMFPTELSDNAAVKQAWNSYRLMLNMVENVDTEALEAFK